MIWFRRGIVLILSLLLLVSLVSAALSTSFNRTLGEPNKVEAYLAESHLYDHFVTYVAQQAAKSEGDNQSSGTVSLNDAAVLAAARTSFPPSLIQHGVNTFIDANYAWLEGKTSIPEFKLDLSAQKADFAKRVGQVVKAYAAGLPVCATVDAARQQISIDPLSATCRPPGISPTAIGTQTTKRLTSTGDFLSNPVLTAASVNPKGNPQGNPYYIRASKLPQAYQAAAKSPYILGVLSLLLAMAIIFVALTRRKGFAVVGAVTAIAGVSLIVSKFAADYGVKQAERHVFNNSSIGPLQQSLTDFAHRIESSMVGTDLWLGVALLVLAIIIFVALFATRGRKGPRKADDATGDGAVDPDDRRLPLIVHRKRLKRPFGESIMPLGAKPGGEDEPESEAPEDTAPTAENPPGPATHGPGGDGSDAGGAAPAPKPKRRKRPRLIQ